MGELFDIARQITDKRKAKFFFNAYVHFVMFENQTMDWSEAEAVVHSNLGYFAGYYDDKVRDHILEMYGSAHPIFGTSHPTTEEAFEAGKKMGESIKNARK